MGPSHLLNKNILRQCIIKNRGGKAKSFIKNNIAYIVWLIIIYFKIIKIIKSNKGKIITNN